MRPSIFGPWTLEQPGQTNASTSRTMSMATPVTPQTLYADRLESAIGTLLLIHDRAIEDRAAPTAIRRAISDYFLGDLCAIDSIPVTTGGTSFQREVWAALRT